jgi:hypothetical protein
MHMRIPTGLHASKLDSCLAVLVLDWQVVLLHTNVNFNRLLRLFNGSRIYGRIRHWQNDLIHPKYIMGSPRSTRGGCGII